MEILLYGNTCTDLSFGPDLSNNYLGTTDITNIPDDFNNTDLYAFISDASLSLDVFDGLDDSLYTKIPRMAFPTKVRFDNAFFVKPF